MSGIQRKIRAGVIKALHAALCARNRREVIAHLCVFMPNQAQQQAVAPCAPRWEGREHRGGGSEEMRGEGIVLAVIRRYLAVTALVSLNS